MLLSFALLVAIGSATVQGFAPHRADAHPMPASSSSPTRAAASTGSALLTADIASLSAPGNLTVATAAHGPRIMPPPPPPRMHPKRGVVATTKDDAATQAFLALAAVPTDAGSRPVVSFRAYEGAGSAFVAHAPRSSRTRGQPVSDC